MQRLRVQRLRMECSRMRRWQAAHGWMMRSQTTRMAAAATWAACGESLVESTLSDQVLADGAPVDGVLVDVAISSDVLVDGALVNNANGHCCRARPGGLW